MTGTSRQRRVAATRAAALGSAPEPFFVINSDPSETNSSAFTLIIHAVRCSSENLSPERDSAYIISKQTLPREFLRVNGARDRARRFYLSSCAVGFWMIWEGQRLADLFCSAGLHGGRA